ncbi:MAG: sulfite exporter TauE/SafE family protein [Pseudomonadota bacterium]
MDIGQAALLAGIGVIGGVWNAIGGGATLFTFPALMAAGLPPVVANATNYVALLPSNAAALPAYRAELRALGRELLPLLAVSGAGALIGSLLLLTSDPDVFAALIPFLILAATLLFAFGARINAALVSLAGTGGSGIAAFALLFASSIYGGYFGADLGIILLAIAQIMDHSDFHVANGIKNLLATSFTILSIVIFGFGGLIAWPEAFAMMAGATAGGYFGGRLARRVNQRFLRLAVTAFGFCLSAVYFARTFG